MKVPPSLIQSLQHIKGFDQDAFEQVHQSGEQVTAIRLNNHKLTTYLKTSIVGVLENICATAVPWNTYGYYLSARPSFTADPLFHAGAYYVQDASSMFLEQVLKQSADLTQPLRILDLCAAPGGKSTLIQSIISENSLLVSNEVIKTRVTVLSENITKWGTSNVIITNNDPRDFQRLPGYFDVIVVDAPCSGSGLFRKDPAAVEEWSEQNVVLCSQRQQRILTDVLPALKTGGTLIYATCSYSAAEDEEIAEWLVKEHSLSPSRYRLQSEWNITETTAPQNGAFGYRFFPDKVKGEGFFIAGFKKTLPGEISRREWKEQTEEDCLTQKEIAVIKPWLKNAVNYFYIRQHEEIIAVPVSLKNDLARIKAALYIKKAGVKLGTIIRDELIPAPELALSTALNLGIHTVEIDKVTALQYLRRQEIKLDIHIRGWALLTYHQLPLGWIKALPNRVNNYYPKEWRIFNK